MSFQEERSVAVQRLVQRLYQRANVLDPSGQLTNNTMPRQTLATQHGISTQPDFEQLLMALAEIRVRKVISYTEARYNALRNPDKAAEEFLSCFFDMRRKYQRICSIMLSADLLDLGEAGTIGSVAESLVDNLADLAVYAVDTLLVAAYLSQERQKGDD